MSAPDDPTRPGEKPGDVVPPDAPYAAEALCPDCDGKGCPSCSDTGTVTEPVGGG